MAEAVAHFDSQAEEAEKNMPFLDVTDLASGVVSAVGGLTKTAPAAAYSMQMGLRRPEQYTEEAKKAFAAEKDYKRKRNPYTKSFSPWLKNLRFGKRDQKLSVMRRQWVQAGSF